MDVWINLKEDILSPMRLDNNIFGRSMGKLFETETLKTNFPADLFELAI